MLSHQPQYLPLTIGQLWKGVGALPLLQLLGQVLSQSGFFCYPTFGELAKALYPNMWESVIVQLIKNIPVYPLQIWMDVGIYDLEMLLEPNERMFALLKNRGYDVTLRRFSGGHSWYPWRQDLPFGLQRLFPFAGKAI